MAALTLQIKNREGAVLAGRTNPGFVNLVYRQAYQSGDRIVLSSSEPDTFLVIQLDDAMGPCMVFLRGCEYSLEIPFEEKRVSYNLKAFAGSLHLLKARVASDVEKAAYRNLALNEYDCHENVTCFPHASANVETRGESVFAARNAIDGNTENHSHGSWPFESWGINQNPNAEMTVDFGRSVEIDRIVLFTRADFPHDNWWKSAEFVFSDGSAETVSMEKSDQPHEFRISKRQITWMKLRNLKKEETDPSPFPALSQIEVYGTEAGSAERMF